MQRIQEFRKMTLSLLAARCSLLVLAVLACTGAHCQIVNTCGVHSVAEYRAVPKSTDNPEARQFVEALLKRAGWQDLKKATITLTGTQTLFGHPTKPWAATYKPDGTVHFERSDSSGGFQVDITRYVATVTVHGKPQIFYSYPFRLDVDVLPFQAPFELKDATQLELPKTRGANSSPPPDNHATEVRFYDHDPNLSVAPGRVAFEARLFVDPETQLPSETRVCRPGARDMRTSVEFTRKYSNYTQTNGISYPATITTYIAGSLFDTIQISSFTVSQ